MVRTHDLSLTAGLHIVALTGGQWHGGLLPKATLVQGFWASVRL